MPLVGSKEAKRCYEMATYQPHSSAVRERRFPIKRL